MEEKDDLMKKLSEKEVEFNEKVKQQQQTIKGFKKAAQKNDLISLMDALESEVIPQGFGQLRSDLFKQLISVIEEEADMHNLELKKGHHKSDVNVHVRNFGQLFQSIATIDLAKKEVHISERQWVYVFKKWNSGAGSTEELQDLFEYKESLMPSKQEESTSDRGQLGTEYERVTHLIKKVEEQVEEDRIALEKRPSTAVLLQELELFTAFLAKYGFKLVVEGMQKTSHYLLRTPHRYEEDHTSKMTKLQKFFARPVNKPTIDQLHTHFVGGMIEFGVSPILTLASADNEYVSGWYERRLSYSEWIQLPKVFRDEEFEVLLAGTDVLKVQHNETGNVATFYPNGNIYVVKPDVEKIHAIESQVGLLPFVWNHGFEDWLQLIVKNTIHTH